MTVQNLIDRLLAVEDKSQEVYFDTTPANSAYFHFKSIDLVEDVEDPEENKFIVLSCGLIPPADTSLN
jgi:hypothetical protein